MDFMAWTSDMSVGVMVLDEDHKKLVGIINQLHFGISAGHSREILEAVLDQLVDYTKFHFAREEELFARTNYLDAPTHKLEHDHFVRQIMDLQERANKAPVSMLNMELMGFLRHWLVAHIQGSDKKYGPLLNAHGVY